jgi:hypothetical protein
MCLFAVRVYIRKLFDDEPICKLFFLPALPSIKIRLRVVLRVSLYWELRLEPWRLDGMNLVGSYC